MSFFQKLARYLCPSSRQRTLEDCRAAVDKLLASAPVTKKPGTSLGRLHLGAALEIIVQDVLPRLSKKKAHAIDVIKWANYIVNIGKKAEGIPMLEKLVAVTLVEFSGLMQPDSPHKSRIDQHIIPKLSGHGALPNLYDYLPDVQKALIAPFLGTSEDSPKPGGHILETLAQQEESLRAALESAEARQKANIPAPG